jgi:uncharacterized protein YkwD
VIAVCLALLASLVLAGPASATPDQSSGEMIRQINIARSHYGLPPLRPSASLIHSSRGFSRAIIRTRRFGHRSRIQASGRFRLLGEALAMHRGRRDKVRGTVRAWLRSPAHRAIVLTRSMHLVGAGVSHGRFGRGRATVWVLQTARR